MTTVCSTIPIWLLFAKDSRSILAISAVKWIRELFAAVNYYPVKYKKRRIQKQLCLHTMQLNNRLMEDLFIHKPIICVLSASQCQQHFYATICSMKGIGAKTEQILSSQKNVSSLYLDVFIHQQIMLVPWLMRLWVWESRLLFKAEQTVFASTFACNFSFESIFRIAVTVLWYIVAYSYKIGTLTV